MVSWASWFNLIVINISCKPRCKSLTQLMCEANGIQEVGSSILPGSTNLPNDTKTISRPSGRFWFMGEVVKTYKVGWPGFGRKHLFSKKTQAKLQSSGRRLGDCRREETWHHGNDCGDRRLLHAGMRSLRPVRNDRLLSPQMVRRTGCAARNLPRNGTARDGEMGASLLHARGQKHCHHRGIPGRFSADFHEPFVVERS